MRGHLLREHLVDIRERIRSKSISSQGDVFRGIVWRLLGALGWDIFDTTTVASPYFSENRRVDLALRGRHRKPVIFIEVKQVGHVNGGEHQLFEFAIGEDVPIVIITDGKEWNFFLPGKQGDYDERRISKLDLLAQDLDECVTRLRRYLAFPAVRFC